MKMHLIGTTRRLEKIHQVLADQAIDAKMIWEAEQRRLVELQAKRSAIPVADRAPLALVRNIDRAKRQVAHAEWLYDKTCAARNSLRSMIDGGKAEV